MWLSVWSEVQIVCIIVQLMSLHSKTPSSLASFKSRLVLPFWYRLTQVVLEKRPLNRCGTQVSWYQKGKTNQTNLDFPEARDSE